MTEAEQGTVSNEIFSLPRIDEDGYYCGECACMCDPQTGEKLLPPDVVLADKPCDNPATAEYFYLWKDNAWVEEKKPTTLAEFVSFGAVSHTSQTDRNNELRQTLMVLSSADSERYRVVRGDNLEWIIEAVPEKTEEEKAAEAREARIRELKRKLSDTDYIAAKIAEGAATKEEYAEVLAQRAAWRAEINELESEESATV